jgi:hypothetical protein
MATVESSRSFQVDAAECFASISELMPNLGYQVRSPKPDERTVMLRWHPNWGDQTRIVVCRCVPESEHTTSVELKFGRVGLIIAPKLREELTAAMTQMHDAIGDYLSHPEAIAEAAGLRDVYAHADGLMQHGSADEAIVTRLKQGGLEEPAARGVVGHLHSQKTTKAAKVNVVMGAVVCAVGIIVTVATYSAAEGGGSYVVAWGAIVFGALQLLAGLWMWARVSAADRVTAAMADDFAACLHEPAAGRWQAASDRLREIAAGDGSHATAAR